jgi:hypothetical protein
MKIITKTPTHLHLRANLAKYLLPKLASCLFYGVLVSVFLLSPDRMELQCQRLNADLACQLTTWNMLQLHSQTKFIQLQDAQVENRYRRQGNQLILKTTQGEIIFPHEFGDKDMAVAQLKKVRDFLDNPNQQRLSLEVGNLELVIFKCLITASYFMLSAFKTLSVLASPIWIKWDFVLEPDISDHPDYQGFLHGRFRGFFWEKEFCHAFSDVVKLDTDLVISKNRNSDTYHLYLRSRSVGEIELSPKNLSEAEWREIAIAISEILQIEPPELPQRTAWQRFVWGERSGN